MNNYLTKLNLDELDYSLDKSRFWSYN